MQNYLQERLLPSFWCPGCGMGTITQSLLRAIDKLNWGKDEVILVSGIGCSARIPAYTDYSGIQTTHGRALTFATGIKLTNPKLHVVLVLGDGDTAAIGGNHLIHAARRNIDLTLVVANNMIYGMTGGQISPTSPFDTRSTTSPDGNLEPALDICGVAQAAGATYVAKASVYHVAQMTNYIEQGLRNKGFSLIEVLTPCPTNYGRRNDFKSAVEMLKWFRDNSTFVGKDSKADSDKKILLGELYKNERPEYSELYKKRIERIRQENKDKQREDTPKSSGLHQGVEKRTEIRFSGLGGQGLQLLGMLLAEAAIIDGSNAVHSTSYGPEARGGASRSDVILAPYTEEIYFPEVVSPNILVAVTQEAYNKYKQDTTDLIITDTRVKTDEGKSPVPVISLPIVETARNIVGSDVGVGTVAVGILASLTNAVSFETLSAVMAKALNKKVLAANKEALKASWDMGKNIRQCQES